MRRTVAVGLMVAAVAWAFVARVPFAADGLEALCILGPIYVLLGLACVVQPDDWGDRR